MLTNPYLSELLSAEYRQYRLEEAELERLVRSTFRKPKCPVWRAMVLVMANGLIAAGYHLQAIGREPLITSKV
jgi:hypothetical protein